MSFEFEAGFFHDALRRHGLRPRRILVVGCGPGVELAHIARATGANVVGIDLVVDPRQRGEAHALVRADATRLPFRDGFFDSVYCYHVLEHVPSPELAVSEAHRVLRPEGLGYFGTPNRSRLVGYIGGRATNWEKVAWNAKDYWHRLTGRWSNARGAHAGFTAGELERLLQTAFADVRSVSLSYYVGKYPRPSNLGRMAFKLGIARVLAPSVYFETTGPRAGTERV